MTARPVYDNVILESPIRWADNRRIFGCAGVSGSLAIRLEIESDAIDDQVMDAIEALREAVIKAQTANAQRARLSLVTDP